MMMITEKERDREKEKESLGSHAKLSANPGYPWIVVRTPELINPY